MGSTRPSDRSIGEATFLPQWMKSKSDAKFDFSDSAFSPPADDTFFYIRYPKPTPVQPSTTNTATSGRAEGFRSISDFLAGKRETSAESSATSDIGNNNSASHFAQYSAETASEPKLIVANKPKPGHDFRGCEVADYGGRTGATGSATPANVAPSLVSVASQIMFGKTGVVGATTGLHVQQQQQTQSNQPHGYLQSGTEATTTTTLLSASTSEQQARKGSKSLPATPLTSPNITPEGSPKSRRRANANRFFTGAFVHPSGQETGDGTGHVERPKNAGGWLLGSILGQSRELLIAAKIDEEDELQQQHQQQNQQQQQHQQQQQQPLDQPVPPYALSRKKSISSQNLTYVGKEGVDSGKSSVASSVAASVTAHMLPKPSELREMNCWSPTSM